MIQNTSELPQLDWRKLYLDFETTSGDPKKKSTDPWRDCDVAGIALCDQTSPAFYVDVREIDRAAVTKWLKDGMTKCETWVNHNVGRYDAHVLKNCMGIEPPPVLACTLTRAKLLDTDRLTKGGYSLDVLSRDWLGEDISAFERAFSAYTKVSKDYGDVPSDLMGEYACQDTFSNRRLDRYEEQTCPEELRRVWNTETALTRILWEMEQRGMTVDPQELQIKELVLTTEMLQIEEALHQRLGYHIRPHTNEDCFDVLCNTFGLPVLGWTEKGDPSFDKHTLTQYESHPYAPKDVVKLMKEYRTRNTLNNLFVKKFQELHIDGVIHSSYNQVLRTGRMSCSNPNSQQNTKASKALFHPRPGMAYVSADYCLTGDTELFTPFGIKTMKEVCERSLPVMGYSWRGIQFCDVSKTACIGVADVYEVTLENGRQLRCTAEHGFMRFDGSRVDCRDLTPGIQLKHVHVGRSGKYPSWRVDGKNQLSHRVVAEWKFDALDGDVHHVDEDKENWLASNLELIEPSEHRSTHAKASYANQNHSLRIERLREALIDRRSYAGENNPNYRGGKIINVCSRCSAEFETYPSQTRKKCPSCRSNHRVKSVRYVGRELVYTLTNPTTHNYVTAEGLINFNSQIEFRTIVHYIQDSDAIRAYLRDPDTDFHQWVAEVCGIARRPAKTVNFMMGFGGGEKKTVETLSNVMEVVADVNVQLDQLIAEGKLQESQRMQAFGMLCQRKAKIVYDTYHRTLPTLKSTARRAARTCASRGYVFNVHGRRRHIPREAARIAFNAINQGEAADIMKERAVALHREVLPKWGAHMVANVHDEALLEVPVEVACDLRFIHDVVTCMETLETPLRVPVRVSVGTSTISWADCEGRAQNLEWVKSTV